MEEQEEKEGNRVETIVKIAVLIWSAGMLTASYYEPPSGKKIVDFDPTFIALDLIKIRRIGFRIFTIVFFMCYFPNIPIIARFGT